MPNVGEKRREPMPLTMDVSRARTGPPIAAVSMRTNSVVQQVQDVLLTTSTLDAVRAAHGYFKQHSIQTVGNPNTKIHDDPMGLAQLKFDNCVVKVRQGHDLDRLTILGRAGPVQLHTVMSCGWIATDRSLLPAFVYLRWVSSMDDALYSV